jgi:hypothetical protein
VAEKPRQEEVGVENGQVHGKGEEKPIGSSAKSEEEDVSAS